jgi:hypothetical protein
LLTSLTTLTTGCQKARLFSHVDTLLGPPSQFHFFNAFCYDSSLNFSVDGKLREKIPFGRFSAYYPTASAFNQDPTQPNGKFITISDPQNLSEFMGFNTIQFTPSVSYLVLPSFSDYDTLNLPLNTIAPTLVYYPEDVETPFDGTARVRVMDLMAGNNYSNSLSMTPNAGAGTTLKLQDLYLPSLPANPTSSYTGTQPGLKAISITLQYNSITAKLTYLPAMLDNKNYTFFIIGDFKNFLAGLQPRPRLLLSADGDPNSLKELTLSSLSYPGNLGATAQVTVVNGAYNIPGLQISGNPNSGNLVEYKGLDLNFGQSAINVDRWPIMSNGVEDQEGVGDIDPASMSNPYVRMNIGYNIAPGTYRTNVVPGNGYTPIFDQFDMNLEAGISYSVCLLPQQNNALHCSTLIMENDNAPNVSQFRLRVINLLGGSTQIDVHNDSPAGSLLTSGVPYAQQTDYINLPPAIQPHNLYVTAAGSTMPLFQLDSLNNLRPISMPFTGGNSGTLYIMGLLPGTPYSGDPGFFGPYVLFVSDASVDPNSAQPSQPLFF